MRREGRQALKITRIENHGTLVHIFAQNDKGVEIITFDHTPFRWLWEAEDGHLLGRWIDYDGDRVRIVD